MNDSDQITVKVHNFVPSYLQEILDAFKEAGVEFDSVTALHDVAILRLKDAFDEVKKKKSNVKFKEFVENILNDVYYLQDENIVKVKMRNIPKRQKK